MENLNAEQVISELDFQTKLAKFTNSKGVLISAKCAQFVLDHVQYYEQRIGKLEAENEKLTKKLALRERDHNDTLDLLYKAEAENERLKAIPEQICEKARQMCFIVGDEEYITLCELDQIAKEITEQK